MSKWFGIALCAAVASIATFSSESGFAESRSSDKVLIAPASTVMPTGRYSPFAQFAVKLNTALAACGSKLRLDAEALAGRIGESMSAAVREASSCGAVKDVPTGSPAHGGAVTEAVWRSVMGGTPVPTLAERVDSIVLAFEATDFGEKPEWNFCQDNSTDGDPRVSGFVCRNHSDPCSFLTWGPRGATAGHGREIQWILWMAWREQPALIQTALGTEYANFERFIRLNGGEEDSCGGPIPVKVFLCAIWTDPARRAIWENALARLGENETVRRAYRALFRFDEFDGAKLHDYVDLWKRLGLEVTEIDYGFFVDRATHHGGPFDDVEDEMSFVSNLRACVVGQAQGWSENGKARRCLSLAQRHKTQAEFRLARDVAFYIDAFPSGVLTDAELKAWAGYMPVSALQNFGLSEEKVIVVPEAPSLSAMQGGPEGTSTDFKPQELAACPATVLTPIGNSN